MKQCNIYPHINGKELSMLITPNTRVLDLSVSMSYDGFLKLVNLASVICPVRIMF